MKSNDNLQFMIACLSTHSKWVKVAINDFSKIESVFQISEKNKKYLRDIISNQSDKLLTASIIMEEKRWREVLSTLTHICKLCTEVDLKVWWNKYLDTYDLLEYIPATPGLESIKFLKFILKINNFNFIDNQIISYELLKNTINSYEFSMTNESTQNKKEVLDNICNYSMYQIIPNPSLIKAEFKVNISELINKLNEEKLQINLGLWARKTTENLIFYKDRLTGNTKIIHIKNQWHSLFEKIIQSQDSHGWIFDNENTIKFLKSLVENGLVFLEKKANDHVY